VGNCTPVNKKKRKLLFENLKKRKAQIVCISSPKSNQFNQLLLQKHSAGKIKGGSVGSAQTYFNMESRPFNDKAEVETHPEEAGVLPQPRLISPLKSCDSWIQ